MQIEDFQISPTAEPWVQAAFEQASRVGGGSFSVVIDAIEPGRVVKLTRSLTSYEALIHFSGTSPHFVQVFAHATDQALTKGGEPCHALLMEKLPHKEPQRAANLADYINRIAVFKNHSAGLIDAVQAMRNKYPEYPATLLEAIDVLAKYAYPEALFVELNQLPNWGQRTDGTLVILDLAHDRTET